MENANNEAKHKSQLSCTLGRSLGHFLKQDAVVRSTDVMKELGKQSHTILSSN